MANMVAMPFPLLLIIHNQIREILGGGFNISNGVIHARLPYLGPHAGQRSPIEAENLKNGRNTIQFLLKQYVM
jgi:hypothetical protein